jgi:predicted TPR repeat methyltransferase
LPLKELGEFWNRMGRARKMSSVAGAALYLRALSCLPSECNAPAFVELVAGSNFDITGADLVKSLEQASEFTCGWKMVKRHCTVKATMMSRHDTVAAMASVFVENLAREYADRVSDALIGNDMFLAARVLNAVPTVSKKLGFNMDDITEALEALKV